MEMVYFYDSTDFFLCSNCIVSVSYIKGCKTARQVSINVSFQVIIFKEKTLKIRGKSRSWVFGGRGGGMKYLLAYVHME